MHFYCTVYSWKHKDYLETVPSIKELTVPDIEGNVMYSPNKIIRGVRFLTEMLLLLKQGAETSVP